MLILYNAALGQKTTPIFDGGPGMEKLGGYLAAQLNNHNIEGRDEKLDSIKGFFNVEVKFSVDVDGSVFDAEIHTIARPLVDRDPILDKEVLRVFNSMPKEKWTPAFNNGKPVKTIGIISLFPILFKDD